MANQYASLCPGCFRDKGTAGVCPHPDCGYDESQTRDVLVLPYRTLLHDQYLIGKVLGEGGFGITYLAMDRELSRRAAIKEYLPHRVATRASDGITAIPLTQRTDEFTYGLNRFLQEAQQVAHLRHDHIVEVWGFFRENGTAYLVMPYYEGMTLRDYLQAHGGRLPQDEAVEIMMPILEGLQAVHAAGLLHRDIKPQNIYRLSDGTPILLDFGAARAALGDRNRGRTEFISEGYTPLEQYTRTGNQGFWTDIYACAATLYRTVTGEKPPDAAGRVKRDALVPPDQKVGGLSPRFNAAVMAGLAMEPSDRPQTVAAFIDRLQEPVRGEDVHLTLALTWQEANNGCLKRVAVDGGAVEAIEIPAGVVHRQQLRFPDKGKPGEYGGGNGALYLTVQVAPKPVDGDDVHRTLSLTWQDALWGGTRTVEVEGRAIPVTIPAGCVDGHRLRIPDQGQPGQHGGTAGALVVTFRVAPKPVRGEDLRCDLRLTWKEAQAGCQKQVRVGGVPFVPIRVEVAIPAGTPDGDELRLPGKGAPGQHGGEAGDLRVQVQVKGDVTFPLKRWGIGGAVLGVAAVVALLVMFWAQGGWVELQVTVTPPEATVTVTAADRAGASLKAVTEGAGRYRFRVRPRRQYRVQASLKGYQSQTQGVTVGGGRHTLTIALIQVQEPPPTITGRDGAPMVLIPAGEFWMGTDRSEIPALVEWAKQFYLYSSDEASWFENEAPRHKVYVDAVYIDQYEVTNAQYKRFMAATGHPAPKDWKDSNYNAPNQPVVGVSWYDAMAYAKWAGKRLPTEAEWEYAARGGLVGKKFPWGDQEPNAGGMYRANYDPGNYTEDGYEYTAPVGTYPPNSYGLYDMAGNVWEWCLDEYQKDFYAKSPQQNPIAGGDISNVISNFTNVKTHRVLRGGSWLDAPLGLRVASRSGVEPSGQYGSVGFRCARAVVSP